MLLKNEIVDVGRFIGIDHAAAIRPPILAGPNRR
jgi:hypothetical protein